MASTRHPRQLRRAKFPVIPNLLLLAGLCFGPVSAEAQWVYRGSPTQSVAGVNALAYRAPWLYAGDISGLLRSSDGGIQWQATPLAWSKLNVRSLAWADSLLFAGTDYGVYRSSDGGDSWINVNNGIAGPIDRLTANSERVFAARAWPDYPRLYVSTNHGERWTPDTAVGFFPIDAIYTEGPLVLVCRQGTDGAHRVRHEILRSTDLGANWDTVYPGLPVSVRSFERCGNYLFAGTDAGIFRSSDGGLTWVDKNAIGINYDQVYAMLGLGSTLIIATRVSGLYKSYDFGESWRWLDDGLGPKGSSPSPWWTTSLVASPSEVFVGTLAGVYGRSRLEATAIEEGRRDGLPHEFGLEQNYPNPFNPSTTIGYSLPHRVHVTLSVCNTLGQLVATPINGEVEAGRHEVQFNAGNLASGVYLYRLQAGAFVQTKSLMVLR